MILGSTLWARFESDLQGYCSEYIIPGRKAKTDSKNQSELC